ncbi:hypothetical protein [Sphingomonas sp. Root710]|uniref:hypothetical protein n=1 Tax=Sphingomonas sp. Root710 TaxID=1736594 RepID=UPI00138EE9BC|nr:hypothetical protein [Sphingomonas sp. Root710]
MLYFEWYEAFHLPCPAIFGDTCRKVDMTMASPFGPQDAALAVVLVWAAIMGLLYRRDAVGPASLVALHAIAGDLARVRDYATLVDLVESHLDLIDRAADRRLSRQRHYDWWARRRLAPPPDFRIPFDLDVATEASVELGWRTKLDNGWATVCSWGRRTSGVPGLLLPSGRMIEQSARGLRSLFLSDVGLRRYLVSERPAFGARLMTCPGYEAGDFAFRFLSDLAADTESSLYREIERTGGWDHWRPRVLDGNYPVLGILLHDARVANDLSAYRPLAEHFISRLRADNDRAYVASINLRPDRLWDEVGKHHDPGFAIPVFFDLMVTAAAFQNVRSHMWLMYADHFVDAILRVHDETGPGIDPDAEWPTRGSEILYHIVSALVAWIQLIEGLPDGNWHLTIEFDRIDGDGRIPKSAIVSLARVTQAILLAPNVGQRFKSYVVEIVTRCVKTLPDSGDRAAFRETLVRALSGEAAISRESDFVTAAWSAYQSIDYMLRAGTPDFEAALKAAVRPPRIVMPFAPAVESAIKSITTDL